MVLSSQNEKQDNIRSIAHSLAENSLKSYALVNGKNEVLHVNDLFVQLTGYSEQQVVGQYYLRLIEKTYEKTYIKLVEEQIKKGQITRTHFVHTRKIGPSFYAEIECVPFLNEANEIEVVILFIQDVTNIQLYDVMAKLEQDMYKAIQSSQHFAEKLALICDGIDSMFYQKSLTSIVFQEQQMLIVHAKQMMGQNVNPITIAREKQFYSNAIETKEILLYDYIASLPIYKRQKELAIDMELNCIALIPIILPNGEALGVISILFDDRYVNEQEYYRFFEKLVNLITLAYTYELHQREIFNLAYFDKYIEIPNRQGFVEQVMQQKMHKQLGAIKIIEPNNYSKIVELYGRDAGDELLKQIYERLLVYNEQYELTIGRLSSSSLVVYLSKEVLSQQEISQLLKRLVQEPYYVVNKKMYITLKAGVALFSKESTVEETIRYAERALSNSKERAGTYTSFYVYRKEEELERELEIMNHLVEAIHEKQFTVLFQPKIEQYRGRISSLEALSRWVSPTLGTISPIEFIPIAERVGLVHEIDLLMLEQILQWFQQRQYKGEKIIPVAVNISPEHFYRPDFVKKIVHLTKMYYADPKYLIIEVTESIGLIDVERAQRILKKLHMNGFKTSIDDFGMGYSSLSYLQKLPFSELKIDRSFTMKLPEHATQTIVKAIIDIANCLEIEVIAEGVENETQRMLLNQLGCYAIQGYYYAPPLSIDKIENMLDENRG